MKVVSVVGARPQFIKAAMVSRALRLSTKVNEILIHTGQHYDENMSAVFFKEMGIPEPDYNLGIGSGSHGEQTGLMLRAIEKVLLAEAPDLLIVYGDTNSTLAGALAGAKIHIPVAHIEAGLRSYNRRMPEEVNRVLSDHAADLLFTPTRIATNNLLREGVLENKIFFVGDVMYDASLYYGSVAEHESHILERLKLKPKTYILCTVHRAENTDDPIRLGSIFEGLVMAAKENQIVLPLHPRTLMELQKEGIIEGVARYIHFIEPVGYLDMIMLEKNARLIVTDSGGVQKEAFFYEVPCITLREETEWVELVDLGWNRLVPPRSSKVVFAGIREGVGSKGFPGHPYGDGNAATRIVAELK